MAGRSVREATFDVFREYGLTSLFANPGSTEIDLLADLPSDLRFVLGLHESAVVGMATGWAIGRGAPALAILHTTAGLGNAVGALATARVNRAALVVVVGHQDRRHLASEPFLAGKLRGLAGVSGGGDRARARVGDRADGRLVQRCGRRWGARRSEDGRTRPKGGPRGGRGARRPLGRGREPDARRRSRRRRPRHVEGARRAGGASLVPGVA